MCYTLVHRGECWLQIRPINCFEFWNFDGQDGRQLLSSELVNFREALICKWNGITLQPELPPPHSKRKINRPAGAEISREYQCAGNKCFVLQIMKIMGANKGPKLSVAPRPELSLCSRVTGRGKRQPGRGWRCLKTARGIMGQRPRRSMDKERGGGVGGVGGRKRHLCWWKNKIKPVWIAAPGEYFVVKWPFVTQTSLVHTETSVDVHTRNHKETEWNKSTGSLVCVSLRCNLPLHLIMTIIKLLIQLV